MIGNGNKSSELLFTYLLRLGDDRLVLGHRISEWCGHAPVLEEDIALANIALDLIGQASSFLTLAGMVEGKGRNEDALAYHRNADQFLNVQLVEQPRGDFADTIAKLFIFNTFDELFLRELGKSSHPELAGIAQKAWKESAYHARHSTQWILRLGDGTTESHEKIQNALNKHWGFANELFFMDEVDAELISINVAPNVSLLQAQWQAAVGSVLNQATLSLPKNSLVTSSNGRSGVHTEHLRTMLAEMQSLPRTYPEASW